MNNTATLSVTAIKYQRQQRTLQVSFNHGAQVEFSAEFLRVHSPSAEVQGHSKEQQVLVTNKIDVGISKITPVGNYAIRIEFSDGHDTGLFSWNYLEHLRQNQSRLWQDYLARLKQAKAHRDAIIPIQIK